MDTVLELQREVGTRETDVQYMGSQPSGSLSPLVRIKQGKEYNSRENPHLGGWKEKQAQEMEM